MSAEVGVKITGDSSGLKNGLNEAAAAVDDFAKKTGGIRGAANKANEAFDKLRDNVKGKLSSLGDKASSSSLGKFFTSVGSTANGVFSSIGAAWGGLMVGFAAFAGISSLFDDAGKISDLSQQFGESAESIQRISAVADQSGTSLDTVVKGMKKAGLAAVEAAQGNKGYQEAFAALGLDAEKFMGMSIEEKLAAVSEGYNTSGNKALANAAAVQLMGKNALEMVPLFSQGGEAVTKAMAEISVTSGNTIARMDEIGDRVGGIFQKMKVWAMEAIGFILDAYDNMALEIQAIFAFISNIGSGLDAAKGAYNKTIDDGFVKREKEKKERLERTTKTSSANIAALKAETESEDGNKKEEEANSKANDEAKKKADALAKAEDDANKKAIQDLERQKKLIEEKGNTALKQLELEEATQEQIAEQKEKSLLEALAIEKQIAALKGDSSEDQALLDEKAKQAALETLLAKKKEKEKKEKEDLKLEADNAEDVLKHEKERLDEMTKGAPSKMDFDRLQSIGGGYGAKADLSGAGRRMAAIEKQIELQESTVKNLEKVLEAIKGKGKSGN